MILQRASENRKFFSYGGINLISFRINPHEYMNRPADSNEDWRVTARGDGPASVILRARRIESDLSWYKLLAGSRGFQSTAYVHV